MKESELRQIIREEIKSINEGISTKVLRSYINTALWSSSDNDDDPLELNYDIKDVSKQSLLKAKKDLDKFFKLVKGKTDDNDDDHVAHDFWLTRNGHGAGFWDGDYEHGDELTKISQKFGEVYASVGDDGKVYFD